MTMIELGKITEIRTGRLNANQAIEGGKYPLFTCSVNPLRIDDYAYDCECVLVAGNGELNVKYYNGKFNAYQRVYIVESIDKSKYDVKFLYYFLQTHIDTLRRNSIGGVIKYIRLGDLTNAEVPNFTIETQRKIVSVIEKSEKALVLRKQQIEALSALKQSVFLDMFGDPNSTDCKFVKKRIGEVFEVQTGKTPSRKRIDYWDKEEVPWIKTTEVQNVEINTNEEFITNLAMTESKLKLFPENTILIAMYGQGKTRGQSGILKFPATCNQACAALLPNEEMEMQFVWNQLLIQYDSLRALGRGGNQPNLNLSLVRGFEIIVPPNELQKKYADKLKKIDEFIQKIENSLGQLTTLYNSLLQKAFNGELLKEEIKA